MIKKMLFTTGFCVCFYACLAQFKLLSPAENDSLNYTQVMFEYQQYKGADHYNLYLYRVNYNAVLRMTSTSLAIRVDEFLAFGNEYKWMVEAISSDGKLLAASDTSHFVIRQSKWSNPSLLKVEAQSYLPGEVYKSLVVYDYGVIANKEGRVLWYLPQTDASFRNLNLNKDGSITYNNTNGSYETNLKGNITWQGPAVIKDSIQVKNYHHDFRKLTNGNFLCLAEKNLSYKTDRIYSVIFEISRSNQVLWYWDEEPVFKNRTDSVLSNHINAIFKDESTGDLYISNRNTSAITKIKTGKIPHVEWYTGKWAGAGKVREIENNVFAGQHSISLLPNHNILVFNNNSNFGITKKMPTKNAAVIELKQPQPGDNKIEVLKTYQFHFPKPSDNICAKSGDADLLPNGNMLINCGSNNRVFEINDRQEIVWESFSSRRDSLDNDFTILPGYRADYCSSLYPCYFTIQQLIPFEFHINRQQSFHCKVNNDGSEKDGYTMEIFYGHHSISKRLEIMNVLPGTEVRKSVSFLPNKTGTYFLQVKSKTNPLLVKEISFEVH